MIKTAPQTGTDLGGRCRGCASPHLPEMICGFLIQLVFGAPPLKKYPGSAPASKYCFTSDVMYKKYKRLVYTPSDLLASKLVERKKFGLICFLGLIYCDRRAIMSLKRDRTLLLFFVCAYKAINSM